jgi:hypothetical protein
MKERLATGFYRPGSNGILMKGSIEGKTFSGGRLWLLLALQFRRHQAHLSLWGAGNSVETQDLKNSPPDPGKQNLRNTLIGKVLSRIEKRKLDILFFNKNICLGTRL